MPTSFNKFLEGCILNLIIWCKFDKSSITFNYSEVSSLDDLLPMHFVKKLELCYDTSPLLVSFIKQLKNHICPVIALYSVIIILFYWRFSNRYLYLSNAGLNILRTNAVDVTKVSHVIKSKLKCHHLNQSRASQFGTLGIEWKQEMVI
jgi:hypothetical protein